MKKIFLVLIILGMTGCKIFDPKIYTESEVELKQDILYEKKSNDEVNGIVKKYYESGALMSKTTYKDGKKNGKEKNYFRSSILEIETTYIDGKKNGIERSYNEDDTLKSETTYENGKPLPLISTITGKPLPPLNSIIKK